MLNDGNVVVKYAKVSINLHGGHRIHAATSSHASALATCKLGMDIGGNSFGPNLLGRNWPLKTQKAAKAKTTITHKAKAKAKSNESVTPVDALSDSQGQVNRCLPLCVYT